MPHHMRTGIAFTLSLMLAFSGMVLLNDWAHHEGMAQNIFHRGHTSVDVTWTADDDHYVDDDFNITFGTTLTIEPGTRVFMDSSHGLGTIVVKGGGKLIIEGTDDAPVIITSNSTAPAPGDYTGIVVEYGGSAYINHTFIRFARIGIHALDLSHPTSKLEIRNCTINETLIWGINVTGDKENIILNCTLNNTGIEGNNNRGGIRLNSASVIANCTIFNTSGTAIRIDKGSPRISNTDIYNSSGKGIWIGGTTSSPEITETNITYTKGNGIFIGDTATPSITNCNISNTWDSNINISGSTRNITIVNSTIKNWTNPAKGLTLNISGTDPTHRIHVTFLNTTYTNDTFKVADFGNLTVNWYVNVHVNDSSNSPIEGANITLLNNTQFVKDRGVTDLDGKIRYLEGVEFNYNSKGYTYDKYYRINVSCPGFQDIEEKINMTKFRQISLTLTDTTNPVADAGPDRTIDQWGQVTFDGSGSTDKVGVMNHTWNFTDNGTKTLYGVSPSYTFKNAGEFLITLTAKDAAGNTHTDTMTVTVNDITNPVAKAGEDRSVDQYEIFSLNGSYSSDNVGIVNYTWNFTDGGSKIIYGISTNLSFNDAGGIVVTLTVKDAAGNTHSDNLRITVNDITVPMADAGINQTVNQGNLVTFNGTGSTDNVGVDNYTWTLNDGGTKTVFGVGANYTFNNAGTFVVTLSVKDAAGNTNPDTVTITVNDTSNPIADAGPDQTVEQGDHVIFSGSGSTDNTAVVNYTWTFDNGGIKTLFGVGPNYTFNDAGSFVVTLAVRDIVGNYHSDTVAITVNDTTNPVADAGSDKTVLQSALVTLDGSGSTDNVGIVNFTWNFEYNNSSIFLYGENVKFSFMHSGRYNITLMLKDAFNNTDSANFTLTVQSRDPKDKSNETGLDVTEKEDGSNIWLWLLIVGLGGILIGGIYFYIERRRKIIEGRIKDENEINRITAGRMDFIILRKPGTKRYKKYELHRIQGVAGDVAGIFWDTARDSSWVVDRMVTESREKVTSMFEFDIKKNLEKGYTLDYFGSGLIIRLLGKRFR